MNFAGVPLLRSLSRTFLPVLLISLAGALWWYSVSTNRLAARDLGFLQDKFSLLQPFADAWQLQGNLAYYVDLDPQAAAASYRQAISKKPLLIDAWLNLAKVELAGGREDEARRILYAISPVIAHVSTWKWQELLLARDLQEETLFAAAFNFILKRLPLRRTEACFLAKGFWGESQAIIPHLAEENQVVFLTELMKAKEEGAALVLWRNMVAGRFPPDRALRLDFCQFLLARGRLVEAKEVWATWRDDGKQTVYDGGFEAELTNSGFGWHCGANPGCAGRAQHRKPRSRGAIACIFALWARKTSNSTRCIRLFRWNRGRFIACGLPAKARGSPLIREYTSQVSGYRCEGLSVKSKPVLKRTPWDQGGAA